MSRLKLKATHAATAPSERPKPAGSDDCPNCKTGWLQYTIHGDAHDCPKCGYRVPDAPEPPQTAVGPISYPPHWIKGQLLNVRHNGSTFILTPLEEPFDPGEPARALFFDNSFDAQAFVSWWYSKDAHDPRAT